MCGIFYYKGKLLTEAQVRTWFMRTSHRGPDVSKMVIKGDKHFGFHRLRINDLSEDADQPYETDDVVMICNGEIYNFKELAIENGFEMNTFQATTNTFTLSNMNKAIE